ncbi:TB2/DP1, HVA22 family-domain-containing protein [Mycena galopus ATCC 62051]|nr:TB2/DP1, HVA22 family-domain-containing protein [Mycena galopus ATCC 62051]
MSAAQKVQQHPMFVQAQGNISYYHNQLDKELTKYPVLNNFEQRTQIPKTYAVIGGATLLVLLHLINPFAMFVSNLVGWALPAYLSFKAIETPSPQDDIQWLTYWVVFGFFNFMESFALRITVFILWLQLPAFRGAQTTYLVVLKPVLANVSNRQVAPVTTSTADARSTRIRSRILRARVAAESCLLVGPRRLA